MNISWSRSSQNTLLIASPLLLTAFGTALYRHLDPENAISPDLGRYEQAYRMADVFALRDYLAAFRFEPGFTAMFKGLHSLGLAFGDFLVLNQFLYFGALFLLLRRLTPHSLLYASLALLGSTFFPSHFLMSNNALRQAWAMSLLFVALAHLVQRLREVPPRRAWRSAAFILPLAVGVLFHYSLALIAALIVLALYLPQRLILRAWVVLAVLYVGNFFGAAGVLEHYLYPILANNSTAQESAVWTDYSLGFKSSFFLMSLVPFLAWLWVRASRMTISQPLSALFSIYFLLRGFCFLLSFFPFHDRFFHYAWSIIPVLLLGVVYETVLPRWRQSNPAYRV